MGEKEEHGGRGRSLGSSFISGGVAGVVAKTIIAPIERVKFLFIVSLGLLRQTSNRKFTYGLFISDLKHIVTRHGITNLWRGNLMNIARVFPNAAIVMSSTSRISQFLTISVPVTTVRTALHSCRWSFTFAEHQQGSPP